MFQIYQMIAPQSFIADLEVDPTTQQIVSADPCVGWAQGRSVRWLRDYCRDHGYGLDRLV
ncbi:hypothetical protein [Magnetospira sp. QH-2]|uniref:hypothetical protein n=1 Tax=Magnetospira sp. (strain QH-2) TaxID=1288970 RepID=UPI0003E80E59|nr:hypothetical protein [Magnetospira sp. QH-2]CCQ72479.1 protein of unknown function [Magnetospira sp. QH-2]